MAYIVTDSEMCQSMNDPINESVNDSMDETKNEAVNESMSIHSTELTNQ